MRCNLKDLVGDLNHRKRVTVCHGTNGGQQYVFIHRLPPAFYMYFWNNSENYLHTTNRRKKIHLLNKNGGAV